MNFQRIKSEEEYKKYSNLLEELKNNYDNLSSNEILTLSLLLEDYNRRRNNGTTGAQMIKEERTRQMIEEGWTASHDQVHVRFELTQAAICYARVSASDPGHNVPYDWPWDIDDWKPSKDTIKNLKKAGALIAAEIDRLKNSIHECLDCGYPNSGKPVSCKECGSEDLTPIVR